MAASTEQKVDFLLKKIGYTASKTGSVSGTGAVSGTSKQPFGEAIPSPLVVPSTSVWADSSLIPSTPPTTSTFPVGVNTTGSAYQLTHDATASGSSLYRSFVARSTHGNQTASIDGNWIDSQFGADYAVRVFVGDATNSSNEIPQAGTSSDAWFFDYSSGVLNFNDTNLPAGITTTNVYLVGYRYTGGIGVQPVTGIGTFSSLNVTGIATFHKDVEFIGAGDAGIKSTFWDQSASSLKFLDNVKAEFGDSQDLSIVHDGNNSVISNSTGGLYLQSDTDINIDSKTGNAQYIHCAKNAEVSLWYNNNQRLTTTGYGVTVTGLEVTGISTFSDVNVTGVSTFEGHVHLLDNDRLRLGGSAGTFDGLDIYHNGTGSYIEESGTGSLQILGNDRVLLGKYTGENMVRAMADGPVDLFHDNALRFQTSGIGVTVWGQTKTTDLSVTGVGTIGSIGISTGLISGPATMYIDPATVGDNTGLLVVKGNLQVDGTQTTVNSATMTVTDKNIEIAKGAANDAAADGAGITIDSGDGDKTLNWVDATDAWTSSEHIQVAAGKQLGFADDTNTYIDRPAADNIRFTTGGSVAVTIDENQNIGIGTANPASDLHINTPVPTIRFTDSDTAQYSDISQSGHSLYISGDRGASGSGGIIFRTQGTDEKVRIASNGKVGIGTDTPGELLDVYKTSNNATIKVRTTTAGAYFEADSGSSGYHGLKLSSGGTQRWLIGGYATNNFTIKDGGTGGDERFTIVDGTGKIGINSTTPTTTLDVRGTVKVSGISTFNSNVNLPDNTKVLWGSATNGDFGIYHDTNHSYLHRIAGGTGDIYVKLGGDDAIVAKTDSSVELYWDNFKRLETLQRGVGIGGSIHIDNDAYVTGITTSARLNVTGITTVATLNVGVSGQTLVGITTILDEDNMASNSATALATQQSIKAYVDGGTSPASSLAVSADSGSNESINLVTEVLDIEGTANEIETATGTNKVVIGLPDDVTIANDLTVASNAGIGSLSVTGISTFNNDVEFVGQTAGITSVTWDKSAGKLIFKDNAKATFGTSDSDDFSIYCDGNNGFVYGEDTPLYIKGQAVFIQTNNNEPSAYFFKNGAVNLYYDGNQRFATTGYGVSVSGLESVGIATFHKDVEFIGQTAGITSAFWDQSAGAFKFLDGISLNLGNNEDIKIFHDGTSSRFEDSYGHLTLRSNIIELKSVTGNKGYLQAVNGQDVKLYYNGNEKIRTTNDGTYTTGISTASGVINSETDVQINGTSVLTSALDEAVAMAIALG